MFGEYALYGDGKVVGLEALVYNKNINKILIFTCLNYLYGRF